MGKFIAGAAGMMLVLTAGLFIWMGALGQDSPIPETPPPPAPLPQESLPVADSTAPAFGEAPPTPPEAYKASREERRFNRYDRDRDEVITRLELMSSRTKAFRKLDKDGNNLLSFEEWAAATSERFAAADRDRNGQLTRTEFRQTRPKRTVQKCKC